MRNIEHIIEFIVSKPSYLKEGRYRIAKRFGCSEDDAIEAIRKAREIIKEGTTIQPEEYKEPENLNLRSMWQSPDGKWLYSYRNEGESLDEDKVKKIIQEGLSDTGSFSIPKGESSSNKGLFVWTSDKHVGSSVDSSIYENEYDREEFERRMEKVFKHCLFLRKTHGKFETLFLADLGDPLDGMDNQTVRGGHHLPQNMSNEEQAKVYIEVHKRLIDSFIENDLADNYVIWNVCNDNHSGSFGFVANLALKEYVNTKYPEITFHNQERFIEHFRYGIHDIMLSHGKDKEDRKGGLPLNLDDKTEKYISEYIDYHKLTGGKKHFIKGDLHRSSENLTNKFRYKNVPSVFGASKWIHHNFGIGTPGCDIEVFEKEQPIIHKTSIDLG